MYMNAFHDIDSQLLHVVGCLIYYTTAAYSCFVAALDRAQQFTLSQLITRAHHAAD